MTYKLFAVATAVLVLGACNKQSDATAAKEPVAAPVATQPTANSPQTPLVATGAAHFDGYDKLRFGMTAAETNKAWGKPLPARSPAATSDCYVVAPVSSTTPAALSWMIDGDKFVRYDVRNDSDVAPGGGKLGMSGDEIRKLYGGRVREQPQKYVPGGQYLRVSADGDSGTALIFDTDAAGKVTGWRVGQPPQVNYVEGCS